MTGGSDGTRVGEWKNFGAMLLGLRTAAGLTREGLSAVSGVSVRALADMERGRTRGPQRRTVDLLAEALRLTPGQQRALRAAAQAGRPRRQISPSEVSERAAALALPRDIGDFTAREPELERLRELALDTGATGAGAVVLVAGQPGLGKTAFALHAAHVLARHYPEGQLYLDLRGMDSETLRPREALARLLRALGVAEDRIPSDTDERAGLYRSLTHGRRVLIVLDNAADESQVRPLLPTDGPSLTLVTSRRSLAGLESVHRLALRVLRPDEAVRLLALIAGGQRVADESSAAFAIAEHCGYLPLALRIAGNRLAVRHEQPLSGLAAQLADEGGRLDALSAGDLRVRAAFTLSYRQLSVRNRLVLRRAALVPGPNFEAEHISVLTGTRVREAELALEELADAGLVRVMPNGRRYAFHDLLRIFAGECLASEEDPESLRAVDERRRRWLLRRAAELALLFTPDPPESATHGTEASARRARQRAEIWLTEERDNWFLALRDAAAAGWHAEVLETAEAMHWFSDLYRNWDHWESVFTWAVTASRHLGRIVDEATQLNYLSWTYSCCLGEHQKGVEAAEAAFAIACRADDVEQRAWALNYAASACARLGLRRDAAKRFGEAASAFAMVPGVSALLGELVALRKLGAVLREDGRAQQALEVHRRVLARAEELPDFQHAQLSGLVLLEVGHDLTALGCSSEAAARFHRAREHALSAGVQYIAAMALYWHAIALRSQGSVDDARERLRLALSEFADLGDHGWQATVARALDELASDDGAVGADVSMRLLY